MHTTSPITHLANTIKALADRVTTIERALGRRAGPTHYSGVGSPNGAQVGSPGDTYSNTNGGANLTFYVKESGVGTNTGWVAK